MKRKLSIGLVSSSFILAILFLVSCSFAYTEEFALVTFTFDDGLESQTVPALVFMDKYDMKGTLYVNTDPLDQNIRPYNMTWDHLLTFQKRGWEIGNHASQHIDFVSLKSEDEIRKLISDADTAFHQHNINVTSFASPHSTEDKRYKKYLNEFGITSNRNIYFKGHEYAKACVEGLNDIKNLDPMELCSMEFGGTDSNLWYANSFYEVVKKAKRERRWLIIVIHGIVPDKPGENRLLETEFRRLIEYVAQDVRYGQLEVVTVSQGLRRVEELNKPPAPVVDKKKVDNKKSTTKK